MFKRVVFFIRTKRYIIFLFLFIISLLPFFGRFFKTVDVNHITKEQFKPELYYLNTIDKAIHYTDSIYLSRNNPNFDTAAYVHIASKFTREKFYHGLSHYAISDNWIAYLSGKLLWNHMSAIVNPDDVLKHSEGLCSQQSIVFMEILKRKGINVRSIGLGFKEGPGHFLSEVHYKNSWRLHDVTLEPQWLKVEGIHRSMEYYLTNKDSLYIVYESRLSKDVFDKITQKVHYGNVNEFPAKNMLLFHKVTNALTYIIPIFLLFMFFWYYKKYKSGL